MAGYGIGAVRVSPDTTDVAIVSFEGPDRYSTVGGLATRVTDLVPALAARGYAVTHLFIGDPSLAPEERSPDGGVRLVRWGQWISRYHPLNVYDGEWGKWRDLTVNAPAWLVAQIVGPAEARGRTSVLLFEDWQTAECAYRTAEHAYVRGLTRRLVPFWNANNTYGCGGIDFARLQMVARITTVSRWMRSELERFGVRDAIVVPNGVAERMLAPLQPADLTPLHEAKGDALVFVKIARFDPDKRWMGAVDAIAELKSRGVPVRFLFRGSAGSYRDQVLAQLRRRGLSATHVRLSPNATPGELAEALAEMREDAAFLDFFLSERLLRTLYAAADGVLANSEREPFGLVGLEVMGAGGIAYVGATGEDYAQPLGNCVVIRTDDAREVVEAALYLRERPELAERIRTEGPQTARRYAWPRVVEDMELVWEYAATQNETATTRA
jgi:glycosyltransferase involved in cell wall biosynthesis